MLYLLVMMTGFVIGMMANAHLRRLENLTKEQYSHCVQMIINDAELQQDKTALLDELHSYAIDEQTDLHHLSQSAQDIVARVKAMI